MDWVVGIFDFVLHVDKHLDALLRDYGQATYLILAVVVFCETGLVVTPILPGDSLLFAAGMFAGRGSLDANMLVLILVTAACVGDNTNYWIGRYLGPRVLKNENSRIFKKAYLDRTRRYFEKYGKATIVMARFVPIVRTFAPFVAGVGAMSYPTYLAFSILGAVAWVSLCVYAGYFLGAIEVVRTHFELAVLLIIAVSVMPMVVEYLRHRGKAHAE